MWGVEADIYKEERRETLYLYNNFTNLANRKWPTYFTLGLILFGRHKMTKYFINNGLLLYSWPTHYSQHFFYVA